MNGSMVSRKPSGSSSAAAADQRDEHAGRPAAPPAGPAGLATAASAAVLAARDLHQDGDRERDADQAQPERKEARARTQGIGQRVAERSHQGGQENAQQANARNLPAASHGFPPSGVVVFGCQASFSQHVAHLGCQLARREWLGDVGVGPISMPFATSTSRPLAESRITLMCCSTEKRSRDRNVARA